MSAWEITSARLWPDRLVEGKYPNRGQDAVNENQRVTRLLADGWEPFAVVPQPEASLLWFKRQPDFWRPTGECPEC